MESNIIEEPGSWGGFFEGFEIQEDKTVDICGTYRMMKDKISIHTVDSIGEAHWIGTIDSSQEVKLTKQYVGKLTVNYEGKYNHAYSTIIGVWSYPGACGEFELHLGAKHPGYFRGFYEQYGNEYPVSGTYFTKAHIIEIFTTDKVGTARWKGTIDSEKNVDLTKQMVGRHSISYTGKLNSEHKVTGQWRIRELTGGFEFQLFPNKEEKSIL